MKGLLTSDRYSDMTISCGTQSWKVHQAIVYRACPLFEKALAGDWKEAQDNTIDMSTHAPWMIDHLVEFIYTGEYSTYQHTTKGDGDVNRDDNSCSTLLTKDQLLHGFDQTELPTAFTTPDISERLTGSGYPNRGLSPDRIREGLWISP